MAKHVWTEAARGLSKAGSPQGSHARRGLEVAGFGAFWSLGLGFRVIMNTCQTSVPT